MIGKMRVWFVRWYSQALFYHKEFVEISVKGALGSCLGTFLVVWFIFHWVHRILNALKVVARVFNTIAVKELLLGNHMYAQSNFAKNVWFQKYVKKF